MPQTTTTPTTILPDQPLLDPDLQALEHFLMHDDNDSPLPLDCSQQINTNHTASSLHPSPIQLHNNQYLLEEGNPSRSPVHDYERSTDFGNPIQLSSWPPLQLSPYTCSCCQVLREISHTNGVEITKLEIHGRVGVICHAVLEKYRVDITANQNHEYKMFDFCKESISRVKQFLLDYCKERKLNAYIMLHDPLSSFYEAICVGLDCEDHPSLVDDLVPETPGDCHMNVQLSAPRSVKKPSALSVQSERSGKVTIRDVVECFRLPIQVAAKKIQICPTVIKKICRKHGLSRWPYRKIRSIEKKISERRKLLSCNDDEERGRAQAEIDTLQQQIYRIYSTINV